jgi:hypothetical protein
LATLVLGSQRVVKLCDFGFARAMSSNTMVLTSIKVGRGRLMVSKPELRPCLVSALESLKLKCDERFQTLLSISSCAAT